MAAQSVYSTNHAESVLATHRWRLLSNSAAYVIPYLQPDLKILDIGCGPGSITVDLAKHASQGEVTGIETNEKPLEEARKLAEQEGVKNAKFEIGDIHKLAYEDNTFDMVHVHQVLQHVADPVKALSEMRRVVKPGGIVACRESAMPTWYPESKGLEMATDLFRRMSRARGGHPHPGSYIHVWATQAGFDRSQITCTTGSWCFSSHEERVYWGGINAERAKSSGSVEIAINGGFATAEQLAQIADAWLDFVNNENAWYAILHGEIICRK